MEIVWLLLGLVVVVALYLWAVYNGLITAHMRVKESWSGIDIQLKRRSDLIPNLVEVVKGYAKHEKEVFESVTKARASLISASSVHEQAEANNMLTGALKSLFAVAEAYPELKASENFKQLQDELSDTESKIAYARQFYNSNVMDYNTKIKVFPNLIFAGMLSFKVEEFFQASSEEKQEVKLSF
ncbi:MAG: hypothetical protein A3F33_01305 [Candidatus Woykebacteria bacterium RIFCSPHIGHO2_12_FULL_43_10]|uniref:LemA family protein n=1 Tax=Candidatus Woykebacteria bacterium RIFCSPHIGHO2_02_FULL_43_16b TaxID=1802601 RepID=A0A1G1WPH9_9BACT|nr:MAG: hypothetical protein A3F33_01305 [Candidatus Woykebacteria bacterium RIFCSPHIGHO2_12_FULL_43_10]OGY29652.1 MAG: hypothetical protein A3J50_03435 [Candidatus Woykebacteria bacterium RIFCSPHIGHO2_02_FULL_43_16b]